MISWMLVAGLNRKCSRHSFQSTVMVPSMSMLQKQTGSVCVIYSGNKLQGVFPFSEFLPYFTFLGGGTVFPSLIISLYTYELKTEYRTDPLPIQWASIYQRVSCPMNCSVCASLNSGSLPWGTFLKFGSYFVIWFAGWVRLLMTQLLRPICRQTVYLLWQMGRVPLVQTDFLPAINGRANHNRLSNMPLRHFCKQRRWRLLMWNSLLNPLLRQFYTN